MNKLRKSVTTAASIMAKMMVRMVRKSVTWNKNAIAID
jgi:hypothetical protein